MTTEIAVLAKQVLDSETPSHLFKVNADSNNLEIDDNSPPIVNGFDLNATEAALRLRDDGHEVNITVIMAGFNFVNEVIKKTLSMGADNLVLIENESLISCDSSFTVEVLSKAINKIGNFDIILAGRHASDFDNGHVPIGIAERLRLPIITYASDIKIIDSILRIKRVIPSGYQFIESKSPCVVTVSNEIGEPRYPNLRGIMTATKKQPKIITINDLEIEPPSEKEINLTKVFIPKINLDTEYIKGDDESELGRNLAMRLKEEGLI